VAFNIMVPAMLFTKVASTLAVSTDWALLGLPLAAVLQVPPQPEPASKPCP